MDAESKAFHYLRHHQNQLLRAIGGRLGDGPSRLRFVRLNANYDQFRGAGGDATTSFSCYELYLWFATRGDRCVNCPAEITVPIRDAIPDSIMVFQVNKRRP